MTIIPDDTGYAREGEGVPGQIEGAVDAYDDVAHRAEDQTRRIVAAIQGALEGFVEALDKYDLPKEGRHAIEEAGAISHAAAVEGRAQAQTPEMRKLGGQMRTLGEKAAERTGHAKDSVTGAVRDARESVQHVREEVRVRAGAVAETGRRAKAAPRHIGHELGEAVGAWKRGLVTNLAMIGLMGLFGIATLVVLTMALVAGFTLLVGWVGALFLVTLLYAVVVGIAYAIAKGAKTKAAHEREDRMENAREEMRHVVRPVRDAFARGRTGM